MYSTQLADYHDYDTENLILQLPDKRFDRVQRIRIMTHHLDGSRGDLIISTPRVMTFGLQEQYDKDTQQVIGYQLPLIMWGKNGPNEDETQFIDTLNRITDECKKFIVENKDLLDQSDLTEEDLGRLNPLYYKMDKGEVQQDKAPLLYTRLNIYRHDDGVQIRTLFTDEATKEVIDPRILINKRCFIQGAIRLESILIGNRPRIQVKLFEAKVRLLDNGIKSLLEPGKVFSKRALQNKPRSTPNAVQQQQTQDQPQQT